jgi:hypothetical protein
MPPDRNKHWYSAQQNPPEVRQYRIAAREEYAGKQSQAKTDDQYRTPQPAVQYVAQHARILAAVAADASYLILS